MIGRVLMDFSLFLRATEHLLRVLLPVFTVERVLVWVCSLVPPGDGRLGLNPTDAQ